MATIKLQGAKELEVALISLPAMVAKRVAKKGLKQAGNKLASEFRKAAPKGKTGLLKKSIGARAVKSRSKYRVSVKVGLVKKLAGKVGGKRNVLFYYKTLEFGRARHKRFNLKRENWGPFVKKRRGFRYVGEYSVKGVSYPMAPFFGRVWRAKRRSAAKQIIASTKQALFEEAGRQAARLNRKKYGY